MKVKNTGAVLCFNFDNEKYLLLDTICRKLGVKIRSAAEEDFGTPVGKLFGFDDMQNEESIIFDEELMIMHNISGNELDKFLKALHKNNLEIPLKCTLTQTNKAWLPARLCSEIKKEHNALV